MSLNALDLYGSSVAREAERFAVLEALVRRRAPDVLAVQEIIASGDLAARRSGAAAGLRRLAAATGMECEVDGEPAVATGGVEHHPGLLWRPGIVPVPGTLHRLEREVSGMFHGAVAAVFDVGGARMRIGSCQLSPFDQAWARMDTSQLLRLFHDVADVTPGFLGGDFNGFGASRIERADGSAAWYDPDPYWGLGAQDWHPYFAFQRDDAGNVDRQAAHRLEGEHQGRMQDVAYQTFAPWVPTTGHHAVDPHPPRRVDRWYATHQVPPAALLAYRVVPLSELEFEIDGETTWLSDHAPIEIDVDEQQLLPN